MHSPTHHFLTTYRRHYRVDLFHGEGNDARQKGLLPTHTVLFHQ